MYAEGLRDAGVPARLTNYAGMPHGFLAMPRLCRSAPQALAEIAEAVAAASAEAERQPTVSNVP
jgi:acetyl esterase